MIEIPEISEKARRAMREANRAGLFTTYRKPTKPEQYADRLKFRALTKHTGWLQRIVYAHVRP